MHRLFLGLMLLTDGVVIVGAFFLAWWVRFGSGLVQLEGPVPPLGAYLRAFPWTLLVYLLVFNYAGLYQRRWSVVGTGDMLRIVKAVALAALLTFALGFFYRGFSYSRLMLAIMAGSSLVFLRVGRNFLHRLQIWLRRRGVGVIRVAIVGDGAEARNVAATLKRHPGYGYRLVGFVGRGSGVAGLAPNLGDLAGLETALARGRLDEVLLAPSRATSRAEVADCVLRCRAAGVEVRMLADIFGMMTSRVTLDDLFGMPMFSLQPFPLEVWLNRALKRGLDLALAALALVLLSPPMAVVALLIKLDSRGPVFYRQERVGRNGRPFAMLKFRSMRADAEKQTGPVWAGKDDPRRTRIGGFLRRTSLDELPQLFNVLRGDMSLVGPRPERPHFVRDFQKKVPRYADRHAVAPGMTGWAQVNGLRGNTSVEERTRYDIFYVENWSLWLEFKILFRTAMEIFFHREAY